MIEERSMDYMVQNNLINELLEDLRRKVAEVEKIYGTLQTLKGYDPDIQLPDLASLLKSNGGMSQAANLTVLPDEFYGLTNTDAAEKYLKKVGHAVRLTEIYNVLSQGGVRFTGDGKKSLNVQLTRATRKFVKIGSGQQVSFGLLEFYPRRRKIRAEDSGVGSEQSELEIEDDLTTKDKVEPQE